MTVAELLDILTKGGLVAALVVFIYALWRRWLIWRAEFDAMVADRDWWRSIAMTATGLAEHSAKHNGKSD